MEASQLNVRKVTSWQARFTAEGGEPGINTFQLILDQGAADHLLTVGAEDADNLFDWLSDSEEVYFEADNEVLIFETKDIG
jgi:hypothetical protein